VDLEENIAVPGFKQFEEAADEAIRERNSLDSDSLCTLGIGFLDKHLIAIHPKNLIVITADSGVGKTSIVSEIAAHNAEEGKSVACLFLEGDKNEFQELQLWQKMFEIKRERNLYITDFTFRNYKLNRIRGIQELEKEAKDLLKKRYKNIFTLDRTEVGEVNSTTILNILSRISDRVSLIVIDHLHYFDKTFSENQNREITDIMKKLKKFTSVENTPVILVSHVKKPLTKNTLILDMYDVKGSSSIYQEADECIMLSQYYADPEFDINSNNMPTLMRVVKSRSGINKMRIGKHVYIKDQRKYSGGYSEYFLRENYWDSEEKRLYPQRLFPIGG